MSSRIPKNAKHNNNVVLKTSLFLTLYDRFMISFLLRQGYTIAVGTLVETDEQYFSTQIFALEA